MKESQFIKCGSKDHIKKDCTAGWKAMGEEKSKGTGKDKMDNKKIALVQAPYQEKKRKNEYWELRESYVIKVNQERIRWCLSLF